MIGLLLAMTASAEDFTTCGYQNAEGCFSTIQEAVDAAASSEHEPPHRILIPGGEYVEDVITIVDQADLRIMGIGAFRPLLVGRIETYGSGFIRIETLDIVGDPAVNFSGGTVEAIDVDWRAFGLQSRNRAGVVRLRNKASLALTGARIADGAAADYGGLVSAHNSSLEAIDVVFFGGFALQRGGAIDMVGGSLSLQRVTFREPVAPQGAAIHLHDTEASLVDVRFEGLIPIDDETTELEVPSLIFHRRGRDATEPVRLELRRATLCGAFAAAALLATDGVDGLVSNSVFHGGAASALAMDGGEIDIVNNHFVGLGGVGSIDGSGWFTDNLILDSGDLSDVVEIDPASGMQFAANHWEQRGARFAIRGDSGPGDGDGLAGIEVPSVLCPDPLALTPEWSSPLRNGGSGRYEDPDEGHQDIGAFGGPEAAGWWYFDEASGEGWGLWDDVDEDGWPTLYDCAPRDGSVHPGALDRPEDGIDQDCDGVDRSLDDLALARCETSPASTAWWALGLLALLRRRR